MNPVIFLKGKDIYLRPLEKEDLNQRYLAWLNDHEVSRFLIGTVFPTNKEQLDKFYQGVASSSSDVMFAIVTSSDHQHIGNIKLGSINWVHRFAELGILIGERSCWSKGYGKQACQLLLDFAFMRLNLMNVILDVYASHQSAVKLYEKIGFKADGTRKQYLYLDGKYEDKLMMSISRAAYLQRYHGK